MFATFFQHVLFSMFFTRRRRHLQQRMITGTVTGSRFSDYSDKFGLRNLRSILNLGAVQNNQLRQESGITVPEVVYGTGFPLDVDDYLCVAGSYGSTIPFQTGYTGLYVASYHHGGKPRASAFIYTMRKLSL